MREEYRDILGTWKGKIKKNHVVILLLVGILLLVIAIPTKEKEEITKVTDNSLETEKNQDSVLTEETIKFQVEQVLSQVEGVGEVKVLITYQDSGTKVVEKDVTGTSQHVREEGGTESKRNTESYQSGESTVYNEDTPYVISELKPKVEGILVIAQGADNPKIKNEIIEAMGALFGLEPHKIRIMKMCSP